MTTTDRPHSLTTDTCARLRIFTAMLGGDITSRDGKIAATLYRAADQKRRCGTPSTLSVCFKSIGGARGPSIGSILAIDEMHKYSRTSITTDDRAELLAYIRRMAICFSSVRLHTIADAIEHGDEVQTQVAIWSLATHGRLNHNTILDTVRSAPVGSVAGEVIADELTGRNVADWLLSGGRLG